VERETKSTWALALMVLIAFDASAQVHFGTCQSNSSDSATIVFPEIIPFPFASGGEIAAMTPDGLCAGATVWTGKALGLLVWGDDPTTEAIDGYAEGDSLRFRYFDGEAEWSFDVDFDTGNPLYRAGTYNPHGIYVANGATQAPIGIHVLHPGGGETWVRGESKTISWTSDGIAGLVQIYLVRAGKPYRTISTGTENSGAFDWVVNGPATDEEVYEVIVRSRDTHKITGTSVGKFKITPAAGKKFSKGDDDTDPSLDPVGENQDEATLPTRFSLEQNFPNPFSASTVIRLLLPEPADVHLEVFDALGRSVGVLLDDDLAAGTHVVQLSAERLASGVYLYRIRAGQFEATRQMIVIH